MFYEFNKGSGLPHNPFKAVVAPRPIGWISTLSTEGIPNLAPYSYFNAVADNPPQVMFSASSNHRHGGLKDAVADAQSTGEFIFNVATWDLREQMNASAVPAPHDVDEFEYAGLTKAASRLVKCPRVAESPLHLECRYTQSHELPSHVPDSTNTLVFGEVVGVHIDEKVLVDGQIDYLKVRHIGRLGYLDYVEVDNYFAMERPDWP